MTPATEAALSPVPLVMGLPELLIVGVIIGILAIASALRTRIIRAESLPGGSLKQIVAFQIRRYQEQRKAAENNSES